MNLALYLEHAQHVLDSCLQGEKYTLFLEFARFYLFHVDQVMH